MHQGAAGEILHQSIVHRVEVLRIFAREAQQAARLVDEQQMLILKQDLDGGTAGWGDKGVDDNRHRAHGLETGDDHTRTGAAGRMGGAQPRKMNGMRHATY